MDFESTPGQSAGPISTPEFLQTILPEQDIHFLVFMKEGYGLSHKAYSDLSKMAEAVEGMAGSKSLSVYHACGTYVSPFVVDEATGKREYRVAKNQARARSFWVDIDCGEEKYAKGDGYLTQREAVVAIFKFSDAIGWPRPMIVDSGYGVHCYWPLMKNITRDNWVKVAEGLKSTLKHCGVIADPSILKQDSHLTAVATHEAAHMVAAVFRKVAVRLVWIKGVRGSGQTIRTRGSDGRVGVLPLEIQDDAFVSYAGYAWEEVHGDVDYAAVDLDYAQRCGSPHELDKARMFIRDHDRLIRQTAAAMLELRSARGWIRNEPLLDLCFWVECRYNDSVRRKNNLTRSTNIGAAS